MKIEEFVSAIRMLSEGVRLKNCGTMLCAAFFILQSSFFISCRQADDVVEIVPARHWVEKTVAVVAPIGDAATKTRLERTAEWFQQNLHEAQLHDTLAIRLKLEWHDELSEDLTALSLTLADREDVIAVIGPFANENVALFAPACMKTMKPLVAPTATSEDVIRRYAVTTSGLSVNETPFLWSLTQTDVEMTSLLMSQFATESKYHPNVMDHLQAAIFAPDDAYGKTFSYWAPFYALQDNIDLCRNQQYTSTEQLVALLNDYRPTIKDNTNSSIFCVAETIEQVYAVARANRLGFFTESGVAHMLPDSDPDDPANDAYWNVTNNWYNTYFAFSGLSEESLAALDSRAIATLKGHTGFSPYADPSTGFELSYKMRYDQLPTFAECKFYDALMLVAFAACYLEHNPAADANNHLTTLNSQLNQAIVALNAASEPAPMGDATWNATAMESYLKAMERGQLHHFIGASGEVSFDPDTYTATTTTTYVQWQIMDGKILHRRYFGNTGGRNINAKAAWLHLYNEHQASEDFMEQVTEGTNKHFDYPALADQYAVLVQGSDGYDNYRHQADVLNVYQTLRRGGFPDDHIILIIDKSLAYGSDIHERGVIRATPDGPDLLSGTTAGSGVSAAEVDYNNTTLKPQDIADILAGRSSSRLPMVVPQDAGQNVFFYWSGHGNSMEHGGSDEFCWRDNSYGDGFTATLLRQTAEQMKYRKLFIVAEPCYGECVIRAIEGLPGVLAMSGASATEQSWADCWSNKAHIWLCDRFTLNFVNCLTDNPLTSFRDLFLYCAQYTLGSHAKIVNAANFGNLFTSDPSEFILYYK